MKKILNCSTWNNLKIKLFKPFLAFVSVLPFVFGCLSPFASAAPAVVPVGANLIVELLIALGVISGSAAGGYVLSQSVDPYTATILQNQVGTITYDVPVSEQTLESAGLLGTVIPEDTYTTDGTNFYVGNKSVTQNDLFLLAKSVVGQVYGMPVNISGSMQTIGDWTSNYDEHYGVCLFPSSAVGVNRYFFSYIYTDTGSFVFTNSFALTTNKSSTNYNFITKKEQTTTYPEKMRYCLYPIGDNKTGYLCSEKFSPGETLNFRNLAAMNNGVFRRVSGSSGSYVYSPDNLHCLVFTDGLPILEVEADSDKLGNAVLQVKKEPDEDDNNSGGLSPVTPDPPPNWELWQTVTDLIRQIDTGEITNGGTDLGQYVNNNYNYVDVDINVPDEINNNVNLSGNLDVSGKGDININFNEDVSLPSAGDGSGFYNPNAADVVGALNNNNPVISGIRGLFAAIDPALVGVFSVSVSLMLVLGLWKLIRG